MFKRTTKLSEFQREMLQRQSEFDKFLPPVPVTEHIVVEAVDFQEWLEWTRATS